MFRSIGGVDGNCNAGAGNLPKDRLKLRFLVNVFFEPGDISIAEGASDGDLRLAMVPEREKLCVRTEGRMGSAQGWVG